MKIFPLAPSLPILFLACLPLSLHGSVIVDSLQWYTSSPSSALTTTSDATVDPSAAASFVTASGGYVAATLPTTLTVTDTSPVTLSLTFRDIDQHGLKIGLFNNGGTAVSSDGTAVSTAAGDDVGAFLRINPTNFETGLETSPTGSPNSGLFYGTQTLGTTSNFSTVGLSANLGTGAHTFTLSISLSGGIYTAAYAIDGVSLGSLTTTDAAFGTLNEIAFTQISAPVSLEAGSVTVVPEPPVGALLGAAGLAWAWARARRPAGKILA